MAKRVFKLPERDELTKEQRKVIRLPEKGQYLIVGAPGTGKSITALYRLIEMNNPENAQFLTFNHVLSHANKTLLGAGLATRATTAMSWLYDYHWKLVGGTPDTYAENKLPEIAPRKPDYSRVEERFAAHGANLSNSMFIIDEGQDLPPAWYECVESAGLNNFFVVADQNQQITEDNSSRSEIEEVLGIESEAVIELKKNWRNTTPIAAFSNWFHTDNASPKPDLPARPSTDIPILFEYQNIDRVKEQILSEYDLDPSKLIGFIVANNSKREWWAKDLQRDDKKRNNSKPVVSTYFLEQKAKVNINFEYGGIVVLNDKSVKGIEFDTVFILIDGFKAISNDTESLKKRMYVMSSRAREKLYLFKSEVQCSMLEKILPPEGETIAFNRHGHIQNIELLKRRKLYG